MRLLLTCVLSLAALSCQTVGPEKPPNAFTPLRFTVQYAAGVAKGPLDGRLLVLISPKAEPEPRTQLNVEDSTDAAPEAFGMNVDGWAAGTDAVQTLEQKARTLLGQADAHRELSSSLAHTDA